MIIEDQTGYLAIERDVESLSSCIKKMITNDRKRKEMGINARQHVLKNFTLDIQVDKYLNIYNQLLS